MLLLEAILFVMRANMFRFRELVLAVWFCFSFYFTIVDGVLEKRNWKHVKLERRNSPPPGWMRRSRLSPEFAIPLRIALKQSNLHSLESHLLSVSTPGHVDYGKHWSHAKIAETFKPNPDSVNAVWNWLVEAGVEKEGIRRSQSLGWLSFNASIGVVEELLGAEYWLWDHGESGQGHVACEEYSVPE